MYDFDCLKVSLLINHLLVLEDVHTTLNKRNLIIHSWRYHSYNQKDGFYDWISYFYLFLFLYVSVYMCFIVTCHTLTFYAEINEKYKYLYARTRNLVYSKERKVTISFDFCKE